jgi:RNA polymerase sigma factor (TIGR02999 family)
MPVDQARLHHVAAPSRQPMARRGRRFSGDDTTGGGAALRDLASDSRVSLPTIACREMRGPLSAGSQRVTALLPLPPASGVIPNREVLVSELDQSVTGLIQAWNDGDARAGDRLFVRVYAELRLIARRLRRRSDSHGDDTLETTALVHEVYLRLNGARALSVQDRGHFFAVAVRATRQVVSNYARNAQALKRGGAVIVESLDAAAGQPLGDADSAELVERVTALEDALQELERLHPRPCRVVECRYFGGLSIPETALALDISEATVKRDWVIAQAWLHRALLERGVDDGP